MVRSPFETYTPDRHRHDELLDDAGRLRPRWAPLFSSIDALGATRLRDRLRSVERQIREDGVTYNVYADPQGADRPWDLDALPLVLDESDWQDIEAAIAQRARLLDAVLRDLYGPQDLLRSGALPASLIAAHPGFLRPVHGLQARGGVMLHVYAADLARSPDGRWWVTADRTQAPSGMGYALENRLILSRLYPEAFRDMRVLHQAEFFSAFRESLSRRAADGDGPPCIVLLTPGPLNETYFEQALLARYLGFPLVEGADLTVREGCVWLRTLEGLKRVHAIVRRLDEDFCDPLELRADSALGVPGLTDCLRRGSVLMANPLGSGVLESGALMGYLPAICPTLLGEPLAMPSVATWWCGEEAAREDALGRLDSLVFKPSTPAWQQPAQFGRDLRGAQREAFIAAVRARPQRYIAQELVQLSQAPVLERAKSDQVVPRPMGLRVFAVSTAQGWKVLPGGLARVSARRDAQALSMQRGGGSKDVWVRSERPLQSSLTLLRSTIGAADLVRSGGALPTRLAENLFWFGRYCERIDDSARLLRLALGTWIDDSGEARAALDSLVRLARRSGLIALEGDPQTLLLRAASREGGPQGLADNLRHLLQAAFPLRDRLSSDHWRSVNVLVQSLEANGDLSLIESIAWLDRVINTMMTLSGFALDGMTRDAGWRLQSIGRRVERLCFMAQALETGLGQSSSVRPGWLLELADSGITYRSRYPTAPEWLPVLDLLVCDRSNPRALAFQLHGLRDFLVRLGPLTEGIDRDVLEEPLRRLAALDPSLDLRPESAALTALLQACRQAGFALSDRLSHGLFSHGAPLGRREAAS